MDIPDQPLDLSKPKMGRVTPLFIATHAAGLQACSVQRINNLLQVHRPIKPEPMRPKSSDKSLDKFASTIPGIGARVPGYRCPMIVIVVAQQCVTTITTLGTDTQTLPHCRAPAPTTVSKLQHLNGTGMLGTGDNNAVADAGSQQGANRMSYPREFKLMVIDFYYKNGQNKYRTCKEYKITKSMLNGWLAKMDKIVQSRPGSLKSGRSGRRPQFPAIEKQLFEIYQSRMALGDKVGNRWLRDTARILAQQQCSSEQLAGMCQFSERWLSNFKKRYNIATCVNPNYVTAKCDEIPREMDGPKQSDSCSSSSGCSTLPNTPTKDSMLVVTHMPVDMTAVRGRDSMGGNCQTMGTSEAQRVSCSSETPSPSATSSEDDFGAEFVEQDVKSRNLDQFYAQFPDLKPERTVSRTSNLSSQHQNAQQPGNPTIGQNEGPVGQQVGQSGTSRRGRKVQFPQVERALFAKLVQRQREGEHISNKWLQEQAKSIAKKLCPNMLEVATKTARCMFSEHWLHNFKRRYGVSLKQQIVGGKPINSVAAPDTFRPSIRPTEQVKCEPAAPPQQMFGAQTAFTQMLALMQRARDAHTPQANPSNISNITPNTNMTNNNNNMLAMLQRTAAAIAYTQQNGGSDKFTSSTLSAGNFMEQKGHV